MTQAVIDLNVRCGPEGALTYVGFEDVDGEFAISEWIDIVEEESGVYGRACVIEIDIEKELVYLLVNWKELKVS